MSIDVTNKVWLRGPQDAKQRLLLMAIADHANDKGAAYPGMELLAQKSCQSVRNALRGILKLEREGWIVVLRRRHGERARGNEYLINLAKLGDERVAEKSAEIEAEAGNYSPHDRVSPREELYVASSGVSKSPSDILSPRENSPEMVVHEVTKSRHEVTKQASRGDKMSPCIENRKEPSIEPIPPIAPQGGRESETPDPDGKQRGLWELTNRIRARQSQRPIGWEAWVESQKLAMQWPEPKNSLDIAPEKPAGQLRYARRSRGSPASVGIYRGG